MRSDHMGPMCMTVIHYLNKDIFNIRDILNNYARTKGINLEFPRYASCLDDFKQKSEIMWFAFHRSPH